MKLYRVQEGYLVERGSVFFLGRDLSWDELVAREDLKNYLEANLSPLEPLPGASYQSIEDRILPPIQSQEVWAAGVTYFRSRDARMSESQSAGGGDFYDRVYNADRPELFVKAMPHRVVGHNGTVALRPDAVWSVPEPELTVLVSPAGAINGYTVGNDMSSRDIEGQNPLYLPQAKIYDRSCALGPGVFVVSSSLSASTQINMQVERAGARVFSGNTSLAGLKRSIESLISYLYRASSFPAGCYLMTGTGIVPPDTFSLAAGDVIRIAIEGVGELVNAVG